MSRKPTTFATTINEGSSAVYTATLADENGTSIGSGAIDALTLTFSNVADGAIINTRDGQNVLNANNVSVSGGGALVFTLQPADTAIIVASPSVVVKNADGEVIEVHRATFQMNFNTTSYSTWDVDFIIRDLSKVT
jgi:hypothetical protein